MSRKIMVPVLIATVVLVGAMALAGPEGSVRGGNRDRVPVLAARDFNLDALEGRVVLVGFWRAVDCPPKHSSGRGASRPASVTVS